VFEPFMLVAGPWNMHLDSTEAAQRLATDVQLVMHEYMADHFHDGLGGAPC